MRNIFVLPTDKPSRGLVYFNGTFRVEKGLRNYPKDIYPNSQGYNIYITDNSKIEDRDCCYNIDKNVIFKHDDLFLVTSNDNVHIKKVIMSTDPQLILDGVQPIPNEFLEWFCQNSSCEWVEVQQGFADGTAYGYNFLGYKIIIPKQQISPKKVEIHLKNPNECEHNLEVGCIKDVCDCYSLISSEEELLKSIEFVLSAGNRAQAIRMIEQYGHWKQGFYSAEDMRNAYSIGWITRERFDDIVYPKGLDYEEKQDYSFEQWFKNYKK